MALSSKFPGFIVKEENTHNFVVKRAPREHAGRGRILVNYQKRDNAKRFEIVKILTQSGKTALAAVIGHYKDPKFVYMDYDLRNKLGLSTEQETYLEITKAGLLATVSWHLEAKDPMVRTPAVLAVISVGLGVLSIVLSILL